MATVDDLMGAIERSRSAYRDAEDALELAESTLYKAEKYVADAKKNGAHQPGTIRSWLDRQVLLGCISREGVAVVERLIGDLA